MPKQLPGPAGQLEAMLTHAPTDNNSYAVLCHPHPRFGGSMLDPILDTAQRALLANHTHCLRFNFRGVGASTGSHDDGVGEADDVASAVAWVRSEFTPARLTLVGYSFGAAMAWHALDRIPDPEHLILIAPPLGFMALPARSPKCPVDVLAGDSDQYVDPGALAAFAQAGTTISAHTLASANHFFTGQWPELERLLLAVLQTD